MFLVIPVVSLALALVADRAGSSASEAPRPEAGDDAGSSHGQPLISDGIVCWPEPEAAPR